MERKGLFSKELRGRWLWAPAAALLFIAWLADRAVTVKLKEVKAEVGRMESAAAASGASLEDLRALRELNVKTVSSYKEALKNQTRAKKAVYEAGAALQEEKRLLEKQLEIMTTYLEIDGTAGRIHLMRDGHALNDYPFSYVPLKALGPPALKMPQAARIVSKERFANPERGSLRETNGKLAWEPPQVGKDPRSGGLGEYVLFTDSPLILHGPPPNKTLHEAFPHICAGITAYTARRMYENTFVGTKIIYKSVKK